MLKEFFKVIVFNEIPEHTPDCSNYQEYYSKIYIQLRRTNFVSHIPQEKKCQVFDKVNKTSCIEFYF